MEATLKQGNLPAHAPEFLKERKFLMMIPVLIFPFLTMAFWALGGGRNSSNMTGEQATVKGLNTTLPQAQFKNNSDRDKMGVYQTVSKDSGGSNESGVKKDFIKSMGFEDTNVNPLSANHTASSEVMNTPSGTVDNETKIQAKLSQINKQLNQPQPSHYAESVSREQPSGTEVKRLEKMMRAIDRGNDNDPEMEQLNKLLTKLQAIQNPEVMTSQTNKKREIEKAFNAIPAAIDGKQKVKDGTTVRFKLTDSVALKGIMLPKGQLLYGACQVTNQRLLVNIQNIRIGKNIIPVDLTVFSLDGMPGIPAPEAELAEAAGSGAGNAVAAMQIMSMDNSIGAQAAAGGINAAKGLFSKKVKKIRVKLQNEIPVLLRDNSKR
jgi:hypothetical protein